MTNLTARPRVLVLVGLAGCGKSTWAEKNVYPALSSDEIRRLLADDPADQTIHHKVFATMRYLLRRRLALARPLTCIDATNLTPKERRPYIRIAQEFDAEPEAVFFDIPLPVCLERNQSRSRQVPPEVLAQMSAKLIPPSLAEGFARITVVSA